MSPRQFRSTAKDELRQLAADVEETRLEFRGRSMPRVIADEWTRKIRRAEQLADALDDNNAKGRWSSMSRTAWEREIPPEEASKMPVARSKTRGDVAGYVSLGDAVTMSAGLQDFLDAGSPRHDFRIFSAKSLVEVGGRAYVPLTRDERSILETKAVPTIGAGVIEPQRLPVVPQVTADMQLRLKDVIPVGRASSDSVTYLREESFTSGADYQLLGSPKGEAGLEYTQQSAPVVTIAHWIPTMNQVLADFGQLRMLIDNRLRYGVELKLESEIIYGAGGPNAFEGLLTVTGTHDIATADARVTTPTILDSIRVGVTEVRRAGYQPSVLLIDPLDLEAILLLKASTEGQYLGGAFPSSDAGSGFKVWGLTVIESQALEASDNSRNLIVMDPRAAVGLHEREPLNVTVGLQDDQFIRNMRTILAETRCALTIYAPQAIAVLETAAAS